MRPPRDKHNRSWRGYLFTQYAEDGAANAAEHGAASVHDGAARGDGNKTYHQSREIPRYVQQAETRTVSENVGKVQGAEACMQRVRILINLNQFYFNHLY